MRGASVKLLWSIQTWVEPVTEIASKALFQLPLEPSFGSQTGATSHGLTSLRLRMMICETFDTMMWPLTMPALASPISVVLLFRRTAPRAAWSALLA